MGNHHRSHRRCGHRQNPAHPWLVPCKVHNFCPGKRQTQESIEPDESSEIKEEKQKKAPSRPLIGWFNNRRGQLICTLTDRNFDME